MLSLPRYHAPPTPISFTKTPPPRPNAKRFSVMRLQCSPRHSLPALFSLAKSFLVIIRAKS